MITDLLSDMAVLDRATGEELEVEPAIEAVLEAADRDVSDEEAEEFRKVIQDGWLDR